MLALLANVLVLTLAYSGTTLGPVLAAVLFLLPVASFVALFLGWRAILGHQALVTVGLGLVLAGPLHGGSAVLVDVLASLMLLSASMTIRLLVASVWSRGAVDPDTGLPNGIGLSRRLGPLVGEAARHPRPPRGRSCLPRSCSAALTRPAKRSATTSAQNCSAAPSRTSARSSRPTP